MIRDALTLVMLLTIFVALLAYGAAIEPSFLPVSQ